MAIKTKDKVDGKGLFPNTISVNVTLDGDSKYYSVYDSLAEAYKNRENGDPEEVAVYELRGLYKAKMSFKATKVS